jgi:hypothetical protein
MASKERGRCSHSKRDLGYKRCHHMRVWNKSQQRFTNKIHHVVWQVKRGDKVEGAPFQKGLGSQMRQHTDKIHHVAKDSGEIKWKVVSVKRGLDDDGSQRRVWGTGRKCIHAKRGDNVPREEVNVEFHLFKWWSNQMHH